MNISQLVRTATDFQQPVSEQALSSCLSEVIPDEIIIEISELSSGLFNSTYRVHTNKTNYILKIAPTEKADVFFNERFLMLREQTLSQQLQSISPLIPQYIRYLRIDNRQAFLQNYVEGILWHDVISELDAIKNDKLWRQLGSFARKFHTTQGERFGYPEPHCSFMLWSEFIKADVDGKINDCERHNLACSEMYEYRRLLNEYTALLDSIVTPYLIHGDLWPRNVIITEDHNIAAVIDAERAFWGDPISDWVLLFYDLPEAFWQGYGVNLLENTDPKLIALYKGMYYILNILESVRFPDDIQPYKKKLQQVLSFLN